MLSSRSHSLGILPTPLGLSWTHTTASSVSSHEAHHLASTMRRPAPPPTGDVLDLDYGSADGTPLESSQGDVTNETNDHAPGADEVKSSHALTHAKPDELVRSTRKLPAAYDTDDADPACSTGPPSLGPFSTAAISEGFQVPEHNQDANAAAGPSSARLAGASAAGDNGAAAETRLWVDPAQHHPPPPTYPPPALPHGDVAQEQQQLPSHYGYDPNLPHLHHSAFEPNHQGLHGSVYFAASAQHPIANGGSDYSQMTHPFVPYDQPYDPRMPMPFGPFAAGSIPPQYAFPPYPQSNPYPGGYAGHLMDPNAMDDSTAQLNRKQRKKLLKNQKKKDKKLRALSATAAPFDPASANVELVWTEDGKPQALAMISELHSRGVPPARLAEQGVPLAMIEVCCAELGVSAQGAGQPEQPAEPPATAPSDSESQGAKEVVQTTKAENELLQKQEQGVPLTPLEELRRKALASRLAKAAAASRALAQEGANAESNGSVPSSADISSKKSTAFDRVATSGEADALVSQISGVLRGLLQPAQPTAEQSSTSRKRAYRDIDAVDPSDSTWDGDLSAPDAATSALPARRQRISYADNFSRAAVAPSGEVDLSTPLPELPDTANLPQPRRQRPVAADFDTAEYVPKPPNRFLDVPSGLNTVVDLSDEEPDDAEMAAFDSADGWTEVRPALDPRRVLELRHRTATEHYDVFCSLNGLSPSRRPATPHRDSGGFETEVGAVPETLVAQIAASGTSSGGPSTPSREDLLRKELEIKQLMRKIHMMEERKKQQEAATAPPRSPAQRSGAPEEEDGAGLRPGGANGSQSAVQPADESDSTAAVKEASSQSGSTASSSVRLDPALQKQRQQLLALLASRRKNASAAVPRDAASTSEAAKDGGVPAPATGMAVSDAGLERKEVSAGKCAGALVCVLDPLTVGDCFARNRFGGRRCVDRAMCRWFRVCFPV